MHTSISISGLLPQKVRSRMMIVMLDASCAPHAGGEEYCLHDDDGTHSKNKKTPVYGVVEFENRHISDEDISTAPSISIIFSSKKLQEFEFEGFDHYVLLDLQIHPEIFHYHPPSQQLLL